MPSLGSGDWLVSAPRSVAVRAEPAEAAPGTAVTFTALIAAPPGSAGDAGVRWSFCTAPLPDTTDNAVSPACLEASALTPAGTGLVTTATLPADGCVMFGPDTSAVGLRPRDPDSTGGYYQPIRVDLPGADITFGLVRIRCDLAGADSVTASAFAAEYQPNHNPVLEPLAAAMNGASSSLTAVAPGARVVLTASWPAASAETFAYFDPVSQTIVQQREAMQVAWYCSAGAFDTESTGRAANDFATTSDDGWAAPSTGGAVRLWVVLRDSRGGVDFITLDVAVVRP